MHRRLTHKINHLLERRFPEQRIFLRSDEGTRFIRLSPMTQLFAWTGSATFLAWAIIASAVLFMDSIGSGNVREKARREQRMYEDRLNILASERDARHSEALAAQERFSQALAQISVMQSELLASEERRRELETGIGVIQSTLRRTVAERNTAREKLAAREAEGAPVIGPAIASADGTDVAATLDFLTVALESTAAERDLMAATAAEARDYADTLIFEQRLRDEQTDRIFERLEDAVSISLTPLDKMFRAAGMPTEQILDTVRAGYSGQGGPLMPVMMSTKGGPPVPEMARANEILTALDRMNLYRIAAEKMPFSQPVKSAFRHTSGFGMRWGRMHAGTDMAASIGTPIYSTADGVVIHADWSSGYGRLIKIQHEFGIETRYGHLSKIRVTKGQRVSRGERIGDMGNSGRSTGPHLHYEIRVGGKPINPMTYIKAANHVF